MNLRVLHNIAKNVKLSDIFTTNVYLSTFWLRQEPQKRESCLSVRACVRLGYYAQNSSKTVSVSVSSILKSLANKQANKQAST